MPVKAKNLVKEKRKIMLDIIFENIIPYTTPETFWNVDMLTAEIRRHNIDEKIRVNKFDVKKIIKSLTNNDQVTLHIVNNNLFVTFS